MEDDTIMNQINLPGLKVNMIKALSQSNEKDYHYYATFLRRLETNVLFYETAMMCIIENPFDADIFTPYIKLNKHTIDYLLKCEKELVFKLDQLRKILALKK